MDALVSLLETFANSLSPWVLWAAIANGFLFIYFGLGFTTLLTTRLLARLGLGRRVEDEAQPVGQRRREVLRSLVSIYIFGGYGVLTIEAYRHGWVGVSFRGGWLRVALDVLILTLWNELHFYAFHRLFHTRWFYRHIHRVHHLSIVPTPLATYSFHWVEAFLLGSVMILIMPFRNFHVLALVAFPFVSLLLNTYGHMNYDLFPNASPKNPLAATRRHTRHHTDVSGSYGFLLPIFDQLFGTAFESETRTH